MLEKKSVEAMKDDDEWETLLDEIPHVTSSPNLRPAAWGGARKPSSVADLGCGHAPWPALSGHGVNTGYYESDDVLTQSGFSRKSDGGGSSSSLFSGGARSMSDIGSPPPPPQLELKSRLIPGAGFWRNFYNGNEGNLLDDFNLSASFNILYISDEHDTAPPPPPSPAPAPVFPNCVQSCDLSVNVNFEKYGAASHSYTNGFNFNLSVPRGPLDFGGDERAVNISRSRYSPARSESFFAGNNEFSPQFYRANNSPMRLISSDIPSSLNMPSPRNRMMNVVQARNPFCPMPTPRNTDETSMSYRTNKPLFHVRDDAVSREDSLIIQGEGVNYGMNRANAKTRAQDGCRSPRMFFSATLPQKCSSLAEVHGYIYQIAKDQHGCRFLQRMFDEGTREDVEIIFDEIIDHVVELMMNPFGNYLMQKLLEVCSDEQRMHVLLRVTEEAGELVRISLNTHGTRVVQKLIETLQTKQERLLVISALEPGFLALIKDLNGNHVIQRCLQCFTAEDSEFIFVAAAKYCVDIAKHQHGCCVLQRCISTSTGKLQDNLVAEISANGLQLAQDAFGNYVVQYILEFKIPSATAKLTSQFEGNYVHLSMQKFSSHVVEKCLTTCNEKTRSKIINELLAAPYFEQLLQDPHANYVVQTALRVSEGPLHNSLVEKIESYKAISRNSPYSKRIFSHKLLKR
ncbi:putative pumilio homolog 7, chloroplastic [Andrographis paniculata]|uniref:putative pumilio homolog 7, chloroplastic n=1 Tax=Andrographis paniculata TaxID=175694 RepID=UPI0021E93CC8|nr:putative pumilio homolog 7, chloroplastic [Andrographis paniculata]